MDIASIFSTDSSQAIDPTEIFKKWADKKLQASGDTVTISDEGRQKAEALVSAGKTSPAALLGMGDDEDDNDALVANISTSTGGEADSSSGQDNNVDIQSEISALTDQLTSILQGSLPEEAKTQQAQPIQEQINELQMQLNELTQA